MRYPLLPTACVPFISSMSAFFLFIAASAVEYFVMRNTIWPRDAPALDNLEEAWAKHEKGEEIDEICIFPNRTLATDEEMFAVTLRIPQQTNSPETTPGRPIRTVAALKTDEEDEEMFAVTLRIPQHSQEKELVKRSE